MSARLLFRRVVSTLPVLFLVSVGIFSMLHLAPGDPATVVAGDQGVDPTVLANVRRELDLDKPLPVQYVDWVAKVLRGDLGYSYATRQPVARAISQRLPTTVELTALSLVIALALALPLGLVAAVYRGSAVDWLNKGLCVLGGSMPAFWLGILLILLFAQALRWLPASGVAPVEQGPLGAIRSLLLPAVTLAAAYVAVLSRVVRASVLEVMREDFVRTARSKGLGQSQVVLGHVLRNALIPIITVIGMESGHLLGGAAVTETLFALPGMGRLLVDGVLSRDFPMVQAATLILVVLLVVANLVADLLYGAADPRLASS